jgi:hypothetical protein
LERVVTEKSCTGDCQREQEAKQEHSTQAMWHRL